MHRGNLTIVRVRETSGIVSRQVPGSSLLAWTIAPTPAAPSLFKAHDPLSPYLSGLVQMPRSTSLSTTLANMASVSACLLGGSFMPGFLG